MSQAPTNNLPEGTYGSFTRKCVCGATVHVIDTVEQPHQHAAIFVSTELDTVHCTDLGKTLRSSKTMNVP